MPLKELVYDQPGSQLQLEAGCAVGKGIDDCCRIQRIVLLGDSLLREQGLQSGDNVIKLLRLMATHLRDHAIDGNGLFQDIVIDQAEIVVLTREAEHLRGRRCLDASGALEAVLERSLKAML